jgi:hypothetical protein
MAEFAIPITTKATLEEELKLREQLYEVCVKWCIETEEKRFERDEALIIAIAKTIDMINTASGINNNGITTFRRRLLDLLNDTEHQKET